MKPSNKLPVQVLQVYEHERPCHKPARAVLVDAFAGDWFDVLLALMGPRIKQADLECGAQNFWRYGENERTQSAHWELQ